MPKAKTGTVTGANLNRKSGKGKLTNSQRFEKPTVEPISETPTSTPAQVDNKARARLKQRFNSDNREVSQVASEDYEKAFNRGNGIAQKHGIKDIELSGLLGSDPYQADSNAPELSAAEANQRKMKIQRQNNALEVRLEKIKQGRKVLAVATEQRRLIGDFVTLETAGVEVATKVVKHEIAVTNFNIEQSKLVQTQELLTQQEIATNGTIALTAGIEEEWQLKFDRQQAKNDGLRLEIEGALGEIERKRELMEAKLQLIGE